MNIPRINFLKKSALWLFVAGMMFTFSNVAHAQQYASCEIYVAGSSGIPLPVAKRMHEVGDAAANACLNNDGSIGVYFSATIARESAMHVCSYAIHSVIDSEPWIQMALARQPEGCPPQKLRSYVETHGVSEGLFVVLTAFSDSVCLNPNADFRKFVSPAVADMKFVAGQLKTLCASLPAPRASLRDWLLYMRFDTDTSSENPNYLSYRTTFGDFGAEGHQLELWVDLGQDGVKVTKFQLYTDMME